MVPRFPRRPALPNAEFVDALFMLPQTKPRHQRKHYPHAQVNRAGNFIPASQIVGEGPALQRDGNAKLGAHRQSQRQRSDDQGARGPF